jgi:uncharacterized protein YeeX (DUF496 family)
MRAAQAIEHVTRQVREAFEDDVAAVIIEDAEMFEVAARQLGRDADAEEVTAIVAAIAADVDDGLADWLTETAESPAAWFYKQTKERTLA